MSKARIPFAEMKNVDEICDAAKHAGIDVKKDENELILSGDKEDVSDLIAIYLGLNDMNRYFMKDAVLATIHEKGKRRKMIGPMNERIFAETTPLQALAAIDEFVVANGGFDGYDAYKQVVMNAISDNDK